MNVPNDVAVVEVTQSATLGFVEGFYNVFNFTTSAISGYYLLDRSDASKNFYLNHVTVDPNDDEWEEQTFTLIGRGRKIDRGTHLGVKGSLSCQLYPTPSRTVRQQWNEIRELRQSGCDAIFIRTPSGIYGRSQSRASLETGAQVSA